MPAVATRLEVSVSTAHRLLGCSPLWGRRFRPQAGSSGRTFSGRTRIRYSAERLRTWVACLTEAATTMAPT